MSDGDQRNVVVGSFVVFTCSADRDKQVVWIKRSDDEEISNVEYPDWVEEHRVKVTHAFEINFRCIFQLWSRLISQQSRGIEPDDGRMLAFQHVTPGDNGWYHCLTRGAKGIGVTVESASKMTVLGGKSHILLLMLKWWSK